MTPVETLGCGCIIDSLGQTTPCVHHANVRRADAHPIAALIASRAYFDKGRCLGHDQFNGRYCRDVAGPEQWCIHCAGFMLIDALTAGTQARHEAEKELRVAQIWRQLAEPALERGAEALNQLDAEREARQQAEARATYEIGAMNEVLRQAERERDEATRAREAALQKRDIAERRIDELLIQLTASGQLQNEERDRDGLFSALKAKEAEIDTLRGARKEMRAQLTASDRAREQAEQEREALQSQAIAVSTALSEAGCNAMPIPQGVRWLVGQREALRTALEGLNLQPGYEFCCCDMATGDNGATEHHESCLMARAALSASQARETTRSTVEYRCVSCGHIDHVNAETHVARLCSRTNCNGTQWPALERPHHPKCSDEACDPRCVHAQGF